MSDRATRSSANPTRPASARHRVCPWWLGPLLASRLRRFYEKPERVVGPFVQPGMTVLEPGCGMGFFSVPLARLVGRTGRVVCVDPQPKMLEGLKRRADKAGVLDRIETVLAGGEDLRVDAWVGKIDAAFAIHVIHELPDAAAFLRQLHRALRPGGTLVISEPRGHVSEEHFGATIALAEQAGFTRLPRGVATRSLGAALTKDLE